jgi:hypothetical protein
MRQFRDLDGISIHFIAEGQEDSIKPEWTEIEVSNEPPPPIDLPYFIKRMKDYPAIGDQLDMLWHMMDNEVISGKNSEWYNTIAAIKDKYPKPE